MPNINAGAVDALTFPPLGLLNPVLDANGPYASGSHTLTSFTTNGAFLLPAGTYQIHGTYGVLVQPNGAIPVTWGIDYGYDSGGPIGAEGNRYFNRFAQLVAMHQFFSGAFATTEIFEAHRLAETFFWPFRLIGGDQLGLHVTPGVSVDLYFLCIL